MQDIIENIIQERNSKEKQKIIDKFREFASEKKNIHEILEIYRKAKSLLESGEDKEKIASARVINNIYSIFPYHYFGIDDTKTEIKDDEVVDLVCTCLKLLLSENGNLRIASAYLINHLRSYLTDYEFVELFFNLMSLREFEKLKKKVAIEFCLDKIYCPHLEEAIESLMPNEVKKMEIKLHGMITEESKMRAKNVKDMARKMVKETEEYIPRILSFRGELFFKENLIPYIENIGLFQLLYELQSINKIFENLNNKGYSSYVATRLFFLLEKNLDKLEKVESKEQLSLIVPDLKKEQLIFMPLDKFYFTLKEIYEKMNETFEVSDEP